MAGEFVVSVFNFVSLVWLQLAVGDAGPADWQCWSCSRSAATLERRNLQPQAAPAAATSATSGIVHRQSQLRLLRLDVAQAGSSKPSGPLDLPASIRVSPGKAQAVPIQVRANETLGDFVVFLNVPDWLQFSNGTKAVQGIWFLPSRLLPQTKISVSDDHGGRHELTVRALIRGQHKSWEYRLAIEVQEQRARSHKADRLRLHQERSLSAELEAVVLRRAHAHMAVGSVASARRLYRHLADKGSVSAAFYLAVSYDPKHLKKLGVTGLRGDQSKADDWVRRATELMMTGKSQQSIANE